MNDALDRATSDPTAHASQHAELHSDTVHVPLLGTVTVTGGIYTVVFGALIVLTALEVLIFELLKYTEGTVFAVRSVLLFTISLLKVILVVWFYMHLKSDNPIFRFILLVPVIIAVVSLVFLLGVPVGPGGGYR